MTGVRHPVFLQNRDGPQSSHLERRRRYQQRCCREHPFQPLVQQLGLLTSPPVRQKGSIEICSLLSPVTASMIYKRVGLPIVTEKFPTLRGGLGIYVGFYSRRRLSPTPFI